MNYADDIQAHDPNHNILFSLHLYCEWSVGGNSPISLLPGVKNAGIPIIVGEFGFQHSEGSGTCDINESSVISTANSNGIGWLAWSWKGNGSGVAYLDLSNDWAGTSLTGWGNTVVNGSGGTKTATTASVFSTTGGGGTTVSNGTYRITARHSGKSLDVTGFSTADGANVTQYTYGGGNNQRWFVQDLGGGVYSIRNVNSNKSLDVSGSSTANNADINQWTYSGGNNQRWRIESVGSGYYRIVSVNSSKCIDLVGGSTADGTAINQYTCNGANNQSFSFERLSSSTSKIATATDMALEESSPQVSVYPNPSDDEFNIYQKGAFTYTIKDMLGRVVERGKGADRLLVGNKLLKGMYLLQIITPAKTVSMKLVKD